WLLLTAFVFVWGLREFKELLKPTDLSLDVPGLHERVVRGPAVTDKPDDREEATFVFNRLSAAGKGLTLAAVLLGPWMGFGARQFLTVFGRTCYRMRWPLFTIACMLAIAFTTRYSGMDATLGLAFTRTGWLYPFFAALLGWLGVALTGSDTSANALFG